MTHHSIGGLELSYEPNDEQWEIITNTEGPMLVVAGPGSGKTATIINRVAYLLVEKHVEPSSIFIATFTNKAAKELRTRLTSLLSQIDPPINLDAMRVGTFHSLCLDILGEHAVELGLRNFTVVDEFDRAHEIGKNKQFAAKLSQAKCLQSANDFRLNKYELQEKAIDTFLACCDVVDEHMISLEEMASANSAAIREFTEFYEEYHREIVASETLSFSDIQTRTLELLREYPNLLNKLQREINYIIVDEYQDTNLIQEELVFTLAGEKANICVVGDDDQSIYRFRGATVQNIIDFEKRVKDRLGRTCARKHLSYNYRSKPDIIDAYMRWMKTTRYGVDNTSGFDWEYNNKSYRLEKALKPIQRGSEPRVISCKGSTREEWYNNIYQLIQKIRSSASYVDDNQIAFICSSLKRSAIQGLISFLEAQGINVYAPRAGFFLEREEVRAALGCLFMCFDGMEYESRAKGYQDIKNDGNEFANAHPDLKQWIEAKRENFAKDKYVPTEDEDAFLELFYEMLSFEPFKSWIAQAAPLDLAETRRARNLAKIAQLIALMEAEENTTQRAGKRRSKSYVWMAGRLYREYILTRSKGDGLFEYEDEEEAAPAGHVSFLTVHQAKGLEFPVVVVCSLFDEPWISQKKSLKDELAALAHSKSDEPEDYIEYFDFWRKYYTAFSRAEELLVLAATDEAWNVKDSVGTSPCFSDAIDQAQPFEDFDYASLELKQVKPSTLMHSYAFTSDIANYLRCPKSYCLHKELAFPAGIAQSELFGTLVHQCIEDIHRYVLNTGVRYIPREEIDSIVNINCSSLENITGVPLKAKARAVFSQVMNYIINSKDLWQNVSAAEVDVSEVRELAGSSNRHYLLKGTIDLVTAKDGRTRIVDFKSGKLPQPESDIYQKYCKQLQTYAHLLKSRDGVDVSGAYLYFTGSNEKKPVRMVEVTPETDSTIVEEIDSVVAKIEQRDFSQQASNKAECSHCYFRWYCERV